MSSQHSDASPHASDLTEIGGSRRSLPAGAQRVGPADGKQRISVSIYLKPGDEAAVIAAEPDPVRRRARLHGHREKLHRHDLDALASWATEHDLLVAEEVPARRFIRLEGRVSQFERALGTELHEVEHGGGRFRGRTGGLLMPRALAGVVESVLGLDDRPVATAKFVVLDKEKHRKKHKAAPSGETAHLPNALAELYDFPTDVTGNGETIALIELGGGYQQADITAAFRAMNLTPPTVTAVGVDGGTNTPGGDADGEVALDIQVAGGLAPGAKIVVYFAPNTDQGFADAISQAANDTANAITVMSISWGGPETSWTAQSVATMNTAIQDAGNVGISVFVASGDNLATDGVADGKAHVDFPASSPYAIGCGGTAVNTTGSTITSETVWNDGTSGTGGGFSTLSPVPAFQTGVVPTTATGRGVPDVAGDAAPATGYTIVVDGQSETVGGTSAVAPLWAGLTALANQSLGRKAGFFLPAVYKNTSGFVDITQGNNMPTGSEVGFSAGTGWDACTGLGRPDGKKILAALSGAGAAS